MLKTIDFHHVRRIGCLQRTGHKNSVASSIKVTVGPGNRSKGRRSFVPQTGIRPLIGLASQGPRKSLTPQGRPFSNSVQYALALNEERTYRHPVLIRIILICSCIEERECDGDQTAVPQCSIGTCRSGINTGTSGHQENSRSGARNWEESPDPPSRSHRPPLSNRADSFLGRLACGLLQCLHDSENEPRQKEPEGSAQAGWGPYRGGAARITPTGPLGSSQAPQNPSRTVLEPLSLAGLGCRG